MAESKLIFPFEIVVIRTDVKTNKHKNNNIHENKQQKSNHHLKKTFNKDKQYNVRCIILERAHHDKNKAKSASALAEICL